jgi:predicted short-subunit dehydrogenase-like oxidoreductase (DUF2520 family)
VLGRGNLGCSLARAFRAAGLPVRLGPSRKGLRLPSDGIVFLAVPDGAVVDTAARIAQMQPAPEVAFVHVSGALGLGALDALRGHEVGSFHPLQSFPAPREPSAFRGITVGVDASSPALMRLLHALARALGARPKHVSDRERVLYHAAAVFASNFLDVVVWEAVRTLRELGWSEPESVAALLPLVEGAVANIRKRGPVRALTGPIRRGDAETITRHVEAMDRLGRGAEYRMLALVALEIAKEAGLDSAAAERTKRALTRDVAATRRRGRR